VGLSYVLKRTDIKPDMIQLCQHQIPDKQVSGVFISPEANNSVKQCCAEYDLMFVG
jgi:hypothetical protein